MKNLNINIINSNLLANSKIVLLIVLILFLSQDFSFAKNTNTNFELEEEAYVDDIPFNTSEVINLDLDINIDSNISRPDLEFKKNLIVASTFMKIDFQMEDEEYVDDIPFDSECIIIYKSPYKKSKNKKALEVEFHTVDEEYIDDIPLDIQ